MLSLKKILFAVVLLAGLVAFPPIYHYAQGNLTYQPLPEGEKVDATLVFTGSSDRLVQGYKMYLTGMTEKLMITGTDYKNDAKVPAVRALSRKAKKKGVTVDLLAKNTIENARNGAKWALNNDVHSILLVTSEAHMARAYFELRRRLPAYITIYTKTTPGNFTRYSKADSEGSRLYCRVYETTLNKDFCYETREFARNWGL